MAVDEVRAVLRALAETRDKVFYLLWVDLTYAWPKPLPTIGFRIYQVADSDDALVAVAVSGRRPDGIEVSWSVGVRTEPGALVVSGTVTTSGVSDDEDVFEREVRSEDTAEVAVHIRALAEETCAIMRPRRPSD